MSEFELSEKLKENIRQFFDRQDALALRHKIANEKNKNEIDDVVSLVNEILVDNGIEENITKKHLRIKPDYVDNLSPVKDKKLSDIIFNSIYPKPSKNVYSHYTNFEAGRSILSKRKFWMFNLLKNYGADEYRHFYEVHGITGYRVEQELLGIKTGYIPQMSEIFSLSLTTEENTSSSLWEHFGKCHTGMKLTFEVVSKIPDFREVYYSNRNSDQPIKLLTDLFSKIEKRTGLPFNFTYISKIGAFYIKGQFDNEQEFRFLIKRDTDAYDASRLKHIPYAGLISYIELPFNSKFARFKLIKVERGKNCEVQKFQGIAEIVRRRYGNDVEIIF